MQSVRATEFLTFVLVIALLVLIYRAPLLALIPLLTVFLAVQVSINTLAILAGRGYLSLFQGIQIYITILAYGAGIDYCLFLTARYKEELDRGLQPAEAVARAIGDVGHTVLASAATVIGGIAMMVFARFGKFHDAGIAIPLSLVLVLCATLTFSPTLLRLAGRWAFWPDGRHAQATAPLATGPAAAKTAAGAKGFFAPERIHQVWENLGAALQRRPGTVWLACVAALAPLVVLGGLFRNRLSYDLIGSLPADAPSVTGTHVLEQHFPAGVMGPVTVLLLDPQVDFGTDEGRHLVAKLTDRLRQRREELGLNDVRSLTAPLGLHVDPSQAFASLHLPAETERELLERGGLRQYTSDMGERARVATRLDLVFEQSPFSHTSVADLDRVEETVRSSLPSGLRRGSRLYFTGPTPSVRDLQDVVRGDRTRIELLVLGSVFVILLLLLRQVVVPLYLLLSVLFSYYATLGITFALFWALDPHGFYGIDWKVAIFLFTILIAVGEDYNIFLIGRVGEESRRQGPVRGITEALARTGPIISSCGIIMAGTFASLLGGSLAEMKQLGFALAFGILLDTFLVRPVLVPSFLLLLAGFRLPPLAGFGRKPGTDPALKSG